MSTRSNIGNVVTNAVQIGSVGMTTASRFFRDRADKSLNNLTPEERERVEKMRKGKLMQEVEQFERRERNPRTYSNMELTPEEAEYTQRSEERARYNRALARSEKDSESIDDLVKNNVSVLSNVPETEEGSEVVEKSRRDLSYEEKIKAIREENRQREIELSRTIPKGV